LEAHRHPNLGVLSSPRRFYRAAEGVESWSWAADNDAYSAWEPIRYKEMLDGIKGLESCLFVTAPDVVGDASKTMKLFWSWVDVIKETGLPVALVAQDGLTADHVPWWWIDALFIGGSTSFKMGPEAEYLALAARENGKWLHMGRVNGHQRVRYAKAIGCDSIDGTSLTWFRDTWLPIFLRHAAAEPQMMLT
jgi:hypothetical protein